MNLMKHLRFVILSLPFFAFEVQAFTLNNSAYLTFASDEIRVNVSKDNCNNIGVTNAELLEIAGLAVDRFWNSVSTSRLKIRKGTLIEVSSAFYTDSICEIGTNCTPNPDLKVTRDILISCNNNTSDNFKSNRILGLTVPNNIEGQTLVGSLILINDVLTNHFKSKGRDEMASIIAHEIGHAIGLGHSPVEDSLMYYATMSQRKALGLDDVDGITYLYPKEQPISMCGSVVMNSTDHTNHRDWWGGLFIGLAIVMLLEFKRKKFRPYI